MNPPPEISADLLKTIKRNCRRYVAELRDWFFASAAIVKPSQWFLESVILNTPFARKQPVDFTGREYWREPIDDIDDPEVLYQSKCMGTGAGKTTIDMAQLLWAFRHEPFSGIGVFPAKDGPGGATAFNNSCMIPTIEATPCFQKDIPTGLRRHDFTGQKLVFAGNNFDWAGGQSAAQLGNKRCRIVNLQEQDKYKENLGREAGADYLAGERTKGMSGIKIIRGSTPSLEEFGIWPHLMKSDLRRRFLNCPLCNSDLMSSSRRFVLVKDRQYTVLPTKMPDGTEIPLAEFRWDKEAKLKDGSWDMDRVIRSARFECPHCGGHIRDEHRIWMDKNGLWIPTRIGDKYHRGYHLPSYCAPMVKDKYGVLEFASTFGGMAQKFLKAKDSANGMAGYINSDLAEVNAAQEHSAGKIEIATRKVSDGKSWKNILTADVQQNWPYFWFVVRRWLLVDGDDGKRGDSYAVEVGHVDDWRDIDDLQAKHKIENTAVVIDSGWGATDNADVYSECFRRAKKFCWCNPATRQFNPENMAGMFPFALDGWLPSKGFPKDKRWKDAQRIVQPYEMRIDDPMKGKAEAHQMFHWVFNFSKVFFLDELQRIREKKTRVWALADDCVFTGDQMTKVEDYEKHMRGKWKDSDGVWQEKKLDHLYDCENMQLAYAFYTGIFDYKSATKTQEAK